MGVVSRPLDYLPAKYLSRSLVSAFTSRVCTLHASGWVCPIAKKEAFSQVALVALHPASISRMRRLKEADSA